MGKLIRIGLCLAFTQVGNANAGELDWLVGCWESEDGSSTEAWALETDGSLIGFSTSVRGFYELMSLKRSDDGSWEFTAHPSGQARTSFRSVELGATSFVVANPEHDFPQRIAYRREDNRLIAEISLMDGSKLTSFEKIACD